MSAKRKLLGRAAAVGLLLSLVAPVYGLVIKPIIDTHERLDSTYLTARDLIARYEGIALKEPEIKSFQRKLETQQSRSGIYLNGATVALAAVELQDRINNQARRSDARVQSIQTLATQTEQAFRQAAVRVQMTATLKSLQKLLYGLESGRPFILITTLEVKSSSGRARVDKRTGEPTLTVRFDAWGFMRPGGV
jgi:hypothetical protein